jgi:heme-degrading monooxygenase HmoA
MNRRTSLKVLAAAAPAALAVPAAGAAPIQLHVDMEVDPAKEQEMLKNYRSTFRPAISRQPGFVEVKLLKLNKAVAGKSPAPFNYRLLLSFETEPQRLAWVKTDEHQRVWPTIENTLKGAKYTAILYDTV